MKTCPICKKEIKQLNPKHIKNCFNGDVDYKIKFINHNFPLTSDINYLTDSYVNRGDSLPILCKLVGGLDLKSMAYVLRYNNIEVRTIKETRTRSEYKNRIESTNIERFGAKNPLSKGTQPWKNRNKTVLDRYGVENVWQCIDDFIKEYGKRSKYSKLNERISEILNLSGIQFEQEFRIKYELDDKLKWKFFDFRIGKILIEVNGDYWHANPTKYEKNDIFHFPKIELTARDIWEIDKYKKQIAESNGYKVIYLWESDINKMNNGEILHYIKNQID